MSTSNLITRLLLALTFSFSSIGSARAQCLEWKRGFGGGDTLPAVMVPFDDGTGPSLCTGGGSFVMQWKQSSWSMLGGIMSNGSGGATVLALAVFDDGTGPALYAGGLLTQASGVNVHGIAKWDGTSWSDVGGGVGGFGNMSRVHALAVFDDGTGPALYAGGEFFTAGGVNAAYIAKWNGTSWSPVGGGLANLVSTLAVCDDGSGPALLAMVTVTNQIAKWNGSTWSFLGAGLSNVTSFCSYDDGSGRAVYAASGFNLLGGSTVSRWNGSSWIPVGSGMECCAGTLVVFDDGSGPALFAGGTFTQVGGVTVNGVARWNGSTWSATGAAIGTYVRALTVFDDGTGRALVGAGSFPNLCIAYSFGVAKWTGSQWIKMPTGNGAGGSIQALATFDDGTGTALYAGGSFPLVGDVCANFIARWNGSNWAPVGRGLKFPVHALTVFDDGSGPALIAAGLTGYTATDSGIAQWNGSTWKNVGRGLIGRVYALAVFDDGSGTALFAGGGFFCAGIDPHGIAKWDGANWRALGSGVIGAAGTSVNAMVPFDDGSGPALYAAGIFNTAGGVSVKNIARWNGSTWSAVGSGLGDAVYGQVNALAVFDDGTGQALFAGGFFGSSGGVSMHSLAKWNGTAWSDVGNGFWPTNSIVNALSVFDDGSGQALYVGGADGAVAHAIGKWNGSAWMTLGNGIQNDYGQAIVSALAEFADGGTDNLYAGGSFTRAGATGSYCIAEWLGCSRSVQPFCAGDGSATSCPCGNDSAIGHHEGCLNSLGLGGRLRASGHASLAHDTFTVSGAQMPNAPCLYFQGTTQLSGGLGVVFGDGLRCVGGSVIRLGAKTNSAGASQYPAAGDALISVRGLVTSPGVHTYQAWYRNAAAFCTSSTFNLTNGVQITWAL